MKNVKVVLINPLETSRNRKKLNETKVLLKLQIKLVKEFQISLDR